jgi:hypothetical protein
MIHQKVVEWKWVHILIGKLLDLIVWAYVVGVVAGHRQVEGFRQVGDLHEGSGDAAQFVTSGSG